MTARRSVFVPAIETGEHVAAQDAARCQGVAAVAAVLATHGPAAGGAAGTVAPIVVERIVKPLSGGGHAAMAGLVSHATPSLSAAIATAKELQQITGLPGRAIVRHCGAPAAPQVDASVATDDWA